MKRVVVAVAVAATMVGSAAAASATVDTPPAQCGNHARGIFAMWQSYWGNCTGRQTLIDVYKDNKFLRQDCVKVDEDKLLGWVPSYLSPAYTGVDTGKTC